MRFDLDHVVAPLDCWLLEAEVTSIEKPVVPPPFVGAAREVTDERRWPTSPVTAPSGS